VHEEHDIVARFEREPGGNSVGALAAYLGRCCGHVSLDARVIAQGYRFYPWMSDEIPQFFNKRFTTGSTNLAVTLQAGVPGAGLLASTALIAPAAAFLPLIAAAWLTAIVLVYPGGSTPMSRASESKPDNDL